MKHMTDNFHVTMDSEKEKALCVHMPRKIVKFRQMSNGLYGMNPNNPNENIKVTGKQQFVNTVEENLSHLSAQQKARAK